MNVRISPKAIRKGAITVIAAALLVVVIGVVALAVDTMVLAVAREQLQGASDAAALAGARKLVTDRRASTKTSNISTEMTAAHDESVSFSTANKVLGESPVLVSNPDNASSGDVVVGYLNWSDPAASFDSTASQLLFNSVKVTLTRSSTRGGLISASFSGVIGKESYGAKASAIATAQLYSIGGVKAVGSENPYLLPIVMHQDSYNKMISSTTTTSDQYTYNEATKTVTSGADGIEESLLYPVSTGNAGNWGTIKVGVSNNSTSTLGSQIRYGITPSQLATYPDSTIQLSNSTNPPSITFGGNPGISSGIKDDLTSIIGRPVVLPIYDQTGGNGNNATYRVVAFAPVRIVAVDFQGNPKYVIVQPAIMRDPTALVRGSPLTSWTQGGLVRLHITR
jgi:Flp pilus assembly protein TadG